MMTELMPQFTAKGAFVVLTVEPMEGLGHLTQADIDELAAELAAHEAKGAIIIVRFAHEMNG